MQIHTPTLLLINILITSTLAICLGVVAVRTRPEGMRYWSAALAAHSVAYVLLGLRGQVSDWLSVVLANSLLSLHFALFTAGVYQFQQRQAQRWLVWSPVPLAFVLFSLLLDDITARVLLSSLLLTLQCALLLWLLLTRCRRTPGRGQYFVVAGYALMIGILLMRGMVVLGGAVHIVQITDSSPIQAATFVGATLAVVLVSLGLVLMSKERADARSQSLAREDELTGLNNRRSIQEQLAHHLALARRRHGTLALLILDVDFFKQVNDRHGHLSGDQVLRDIAACIRARLRAQDIAGRWGGEEFIVILPDTDATGAAVLAEQLRVAVERMRFTALDGQGITLTLSIGLHALHGAQQDERDDMIGAADRALYLAKQKGRNRVERL